MADPCREDELTADYAKYQLSGSAIGMYTSSAALPMLGSNGRVRRVFVLSSHWRHTGPATGGALWFCRFILVRGGQLRLRKTTYTACNLGLNGGAWHLYW